jgi:hypothetical protein
MNVKNNKFQKEWHSATKSLLLAPLEVGRKVETVAKAHSFVNLSANDYGSESRQVFLQAYF